MKAAPYRRTSQHRLHRAALRADPMAMVALDKQAVSSDWQRANVAT